MDTVGFSSPEYKSAWSELFWLVFVHQSVSRPSVNKCLQNISETTEPM